MWLETSTVPMAHNGVILTADGQDGKALRAAGQSLRPGNFGCGQTTANSVLTITNPGISVANRTPAAPPSPSWSKNRPPVTKL